MDQNSNRFVTSIRNVKCCTLISFVKVVFSALRSIALLAPPECARFAQEVSTALLTCTSAAIVQDLG